MELQKLLLASGVIAGPLYVAVALIEGAVRPGYNALRQPISALSIGKRGWIQRVNFVVSGLLMLAYAFGLRSASLDAGASFWESVLTVLFALGRIGAGVFVTDLTGMPSDMARFERARSGIIHDLFSFVAFTSLFIAFFVYARAFAESGSRALAIYSVGSGVLFGVGFVLFARGFSSAGTLARIAGLLQRITIAIGWIWLAAVGVHLLI